MGCRPDGTSSDRSRWAEPQFRSLSRRKVESKTCREVVGKYPACGAGKSNGQIIENKSINRWKIALYSPTLCDWDG
jgi:hypothetical protein